MESLHNTAELIYALQDNLRLHRTKAFLMKKGIKNAFLFSLWLFFFKVAN